MSSRENIEDILNKAVALEKKYDWLKAKELYEKTLGPVEEEDFFKRGEVQERIGFCLHRAAMQAVNRNEFLENMGQAAEAYEKAHGFYEKLADERGAPWVLRCRALSKYLSHWIAPDSSEKLRLLVDCHELEGKALNSFWDRGDNLEYCRTYNQLAQASELLFFHEWDQPARKEALEERLSWGERTIEVLLELNDPYEAARAHLAYFQDLIKFYWYYKPKFQLDNGMHSRINRHMNEAFKFADAVGDDYTTGLCYIHLESDKISDYSERRLNYLKKALEYGEKTRDIYLKAVALGSLAYGTYWRAFINEDPDQRIETADEAMKFYDRAQNLLTFLSIQIPVGGKICRPAPGGYAEYYLDRAMWETNPSEKLELLDKSEKDGLKALSVAKGRGVPLSIMGVLHILSRTLTSRASLETEVDKKRDLLVRAGEYRERNIEIAEQLGTFWYWNHGVYYHYLAQIKEELALIEQDPDVKVKLLEDARLRGQKGLDLIYRVVQLIEKKGSLGNLALLSRYQDGHGATLTRLYELTQNREHLREAIKTWQKSIESARKVPMFGRIAESYWNIAKTLDTLGEHSEAAENFERASKSYKEAAEKIPQLSEFYKEYAHYMQAWSEIEKARQHHAEKRYGLAREHYERAAQLHESTERWSYLASNYQAWAQLEEAEGLSRGDQTQEAKELFEQAAKLFWEVEGSIKAKLDEIDDREEAQMADRLIEASSKRREYCLGRMAMEEARTLDRQGDHAASSRKYSQAEESFNIVIDAAKQESDRRELRPIVYLCRAWQRMMTAEARASPTMYGEAAELFMQAKEHALDQTASNLAQAHSSFCKALEVGKGFEVTRETALYSTAKRHIEAASSYYLRAGYQSASEYTTATNRLLDAYMYMYKAQTETDPEQKTRLYQMAERLLQASAGSYLKAKHPEKSDEIRRVLEKIKEEKQIAMALTEILHAPSVMSTTSSFSTPTPTHEQAVGLERFEHADIQANLILRGRDVEIGDDVNIEIELVNAGKAPAQMIKVEEIVPDGFEVKEAPDICRVKDSYLDMKGRTLNPLKTEELKLILRPRDKGTYHLRPRILFLDEAGRYRSHEPEPVIVTVKELGIKGWLRGPPR